MAFKKIALSEDEHTEDHPHDGGVTQKLDVVNTHVNAVGSPDLHHDRDHRLDSHIELNHSSLTLSGTDEHHDKIHEHHLNSYISFGDLQSDGFSIGPNPS